MDSTSGSEIPVDLLKGHFSFNEKSRNKGKAQGNFLRKFSENAKSVESPKYKPFTWQNARNPGINRDMFHGGISQVWTKLNQIYFSWCESFHSRNSPEIESDGNFWENLLKLWVYLARQNSVTYKISWFSSRCFTVLCWIERAHVWEAFRRILLLSPLDSSKTKLRVLNKK